MDFANRQLMGLSPSFNDRRLTGLAPGDADLKKHTCGKEDWEPELSNDENCEGCEQVRRNFCDWCGYGDSFKTHNTEAHILGGDPVANRMGERAWEAKFGNKPYRLRG